MSTEHIFELTWTQLYRVLHDDTSRENLIDLFNSCGEIRVEPADAVAITVASHNGDKKEEYMVNRKIHVIEDLRRTKGLPFGRFKFNDEIIDNDDTWINLGIEDGAVLTLMTRTDVKEEVDYIVRQLYYLDNDDDYNLEEYYNLNWHTEEENDIGFTLDFIRKNITSIPDVFGGLDVRSIKCKDCERLTFVAIPDSVTSIEESAFWGCERLTFVVIPKGVASIGEDAFSDCKRLTSVTIPEGVTEIGDGAFIDCENLTSVVIPDNVTEIGGAVFEHCTSLTSVVIPDNVTEIGGAVFEHCTSLTSVVIPDNVTSIRGLAFRSCERLTFVVIPKGVTEIGRGAFWGCKELTSVTIPVSVTSIGSRAFTYCESLTSVTIPGNVTEIAEAAFYGCTNMTSIIIPDSVKSIGYSAFQYCESLTSVVIPKTVRLGEDAFDNEYVEIIEYK